ncbi:hypothetical protein NDU88_006094 [Pleurodeles waltl]|uniref:Uncharacterized protein n=1 Tax=Pleurodeles waltl TaxID=8319 RepID=A0AAV7NX51_PLEWA|nr:hypothetical protein NDU88_006094 [Pleurodeles waltl]
MKSTWDYSATQLLHQEGIPESAAVSKDESHVDPMTESGQHILRLIYSMIQDHQAETWAENRMARLATKHLQGALKKVSKTCAEVREKSNAIEERTEVEADVVGLKGHVEP